MLAGIFNNSIIHEYAVFYNHFAYFSRLKIRYPCAIHYRKTNIDSQINVEITSFDILA